ncbi:MAG: ABC transporter ATP-binding protein [Saprospiraceae bacterium]|nr:MAG: ABC transporter ATP-binding protein [Saprospiraceae bacterium]
MLQTKDLSYSYDATNTLYFPDMTCGKGEHWLILGQSGCGKTTLLHLLGGLLTPRTGQVRVADTTLNALPLSDLDRFRGRHIGIVFQVPHFIQALTIVENLSLAQYLAGLPADRARIESLLDRLGIGHKGNSLPDALSQGERQRAAIARALVNRPALILADEPTSALDDVNAAEVADLLEEAASEVQATLLIVTHDGRLKERFPNKILLQPQGIPSGF